HLLFNLGIFPLTQQLPGPIFQGMLLQVVWRPHRRRLLRRSNRVTPGRLRRSCSLLPVHAAAENCERDERAGEAHRQGTQNHSDIVADLAIGFLSNTMNPATISNGLKMS